MLFSSRASGFQVRCKSKARSRRAGRQRWVARRLEARLWLRPRSPCVRSSGHTEAARDGGSVVPLGASSACAASKTHGKACLAGHAHAPRLPHLERTRREALSGPATCFDRATTAENAVLLRHRPLLPRPLHRVQGLPNKPMSDFPRGCSVWRARVGTSSPMLFFATSFVF